MKKEKHILTVIVLALFSLTSYAQKEHLIGLWKVEQVTVDQENMTPVAKWFRINNDGTYQAGNGWLQNGNGFWNYDSQNKLFTANDPLDIADQFGGFTLSFDESKMLWRREEEGMPVTITLAPIEKLPMSPADYLKGVWDLIEIIEDGVSITADIDKVDKHKLFFRWDRIYVNLDSTDKRRFGYWHIHGHRAEITLIPHQADQNEEKWMIEVNEKELLMTGISDTNRKLKRKYVRKNTFSFIEKVFH